MSIRNELVVLTGVTLLTAVVQRGTADRVVKVAMESGAQGATDFHAHGTVIRQKHLGILGLTVDTEKEVIYIVVPNEQADHIFERVFVAAKMDTPGMRILWLSRLEKMATYIPHEVSARFGVHKERRE